MERFRCVWVGRGEGTTQKESMSAVPLSTLFLLSTHNLFLQRKALLAAFEGLKEVKAESGDKTAQEAEYQDTHSLLLSLLVFLL